jgi:hypothetical protein
MFNPQDELKLALREDVGSQLSAQSLLSGIVLSPTQQNGNQVRYEGSGAAGKVVLEVTENSALNFENYPVLRMGYLGQTQVPVKGYPTRLTLTNWNNQVVLDIRMVGESTPAQAIALPAGFQTVDRATFQQRIQQRIQQQNQPNPSPSPNR